MRPLSPKTTLDDPPTVVAYHRRCRVPLEVRKRRGHQDRTTRSCCGREPAIECDQRLGECDVHPIPAADGVTGTIPKTSTWTKCVAAYRASGSSAVRTRAAAAPSVTSSTRQEASTICTGPGASQLVQTLERVRLRPVRSAVSDAHRGLGSARSSAWLSQCRGPAQDGRRSPAISAGSRSSVRSCALHRSVPSGFATCSRRLPSRRRRPWPRTERISLGCCATR